MVLFRQLAGGRPAATAPKRFSLLPRPQSQSRRRAGRLDRLVSLIDSTPSRVGREGLPAWNNSPRDAASLPRDGSPLADIYTRRFRTVDLGKGPQFSQLLDRCCFFLTDIDSVFMTTQGRCFRGATPASTPARSVYNSDNSGEIAEALAADVRSQPVSKARKLDSF